MIKKLPICLIALLTLSFSTFANGISGKYVGKLIVAVGGEGGDETEMENTEIFITKEAGDTYALSVKDFKFGDEVIGNLDVTGIARADVAGKTSLTKEGSSAGPEVTVGTTIQTEIFLDYAMINNGAFSLELTVNAAGTETTLAGVEFAGNKTTTGLSSIATKPLNITVESGAIKLNLASDIAYSIYSLSGALAQSGIIENNQIDINALQAGIYILSVNGQAVKFVK